MGIFRGLPPESDAVVAMRGVIRFAVQSCSLILAAKERSGSEDQAQPLRNAHM